MDEDIEKLKKQIKNPNKEFVVSGVSREYLFYMLGHDEEALKEINSLTDEEIQYAINELETEENYEDELVDKLRDILDKKYKDD